MDEVERLEKEVEREHGINRPLVSDNVRLRAKVEKAKEALQEIYDFPHRADLNRKVARAALAELEEE